MSPETDAHEYALDEPFARTIVGERRHLSAYEVRLLPRPQTYLLPPFTHSLISIALTIG